MLKHKIMFNIVTETFYKAKTLINTSFKRARCCRPWAICNQTGAAASNLKCPKVSMDWQTSSPPSNWFANYAKLGQMFDDI